MTCSGNCYQGRDCPEPPPAIGLMLIMAMMFGMGLVVGLML